MRLSPTVIIISVGIIFSIFLIVSFVVYPDVGEKILYGKHPPKKDLEQGVVENNSVEDSTTKIENNEQGEPKKQLGYSEIMISGNDKCIQYANSISNNDLNNFVEEFNKCNSQ
jgi:hypothetical protein